jgi:hypothetical protein
MKKKILIVLTSVEKYPTLKRATGLWLGEAVHFVKKVEAAGYEITSARRAATPRSIRTAWRWLSRSIGSGTRTKRS